MLVYIADYNFNVKYIIDYYKSVIWTHKKYDLSDFEIYLPILDESILDTIKTNYFIWLDTNDEDVRVIENIKVNYNVNDGYMMIISGFDARTLLKRRIIQFPIQYSIEKNTNLIISRIYKENLCNDMEYSTYQGDPNRKIDCMADNIWSMDYRWERAQIYGENVFEKIKEMQQVGNYGTKMIYKRNSNKFYLDGVFGIDRTSTNGLYKPIVYSSSLGNILEFNIEIDDTEFKNVAYILGEGSGIDRTITVAGDTTKSGLFRYETTLNASELSLNEGTQSAITQAEYVDILKNAGNEYLTKFNKNYKFDCKVVGDYYKFNKDYSLGDKIEIITDFKINGSNNVFALVEEVTESWSENGYECVQVFNFDV